MLITVAVNGDIHIFGTVLRCAKTKTVKTEGIEIIFALALVILTACVKLTENKLPVILFLFHIPVKRNTSAVVLNLNGHIGKACNLDNLAVAFLSLVNGV